MYVLSDNRSGLATVATGTNTITATTNSKVMTAAAQRIDQVKLVVVKPNRSRKKPTALTVLGIAVANPS
ncbi:hypothetical protein TSAR_013292 [Trichomalopsis sarcophagae]|uniref:Uncharacterized protein n=1 Tax=Trichomalopsis sarcophagae TaxID=543379 RepID=A0A232EFK9_9HYME|nr:hypothetical protein TSAR_013292 [Trichomalopsis sarcophagae]